MLVATKDRPLLTTVTGSLPRPAWFSAALAGRPLSYAMTDQGFREQYLDLVAAYLSDQHRAGLDLLVDGDARLDNGVGGRQWIAYVEERLGGLGPPERRAYAIHRGKRPGQIMRAVYEARMPTAAIGPVTPGPLEYDVAWKAAQQMTDRPVKLGAISAQLVEASINNDHYDDRRHLVFDLSEATNQALHVLADAGCPVIQVEEPCIHGIAGTAPGAMLDAEFYVEAFNHEVRGLRAKTEIWCHTCWGNPAAQRARDQHYSYAAALPYLERLDVDVLTFEGCENGGEDFARIGCEIGKDKKVAIGVVSHRTLQVETADEVAGLIRNALEYIEPERLVITTDCGFGRQGMSRLHAFHKMVALVEGTNLVRRELGLEEARVAAADPRFTTVED